MEQLLTRGLALTLTLSAVLLAAPRAAFAAHGPPASERIDAWITERMAAHDIPGAAVAVVQGGRTVHLRGYGDADPDGTPVTARTPFLIGSASKPFTAAVVLQLVEEGLLSLDEPVLPHLDHLVDGPPAGFEDVTVRHLLNHTSGLGMMVGLAGTVPVHATDDALHRRVADVLAEPLSAPPGGRFEYSNAGPMLLAAVVEQVTGRAFERVLHDRIFDPLGMGDTFATEQDPAYDRLATGHRLWFGRWRPAELPYDRAGVAMGYIGSSARDLARFLHAHLDRPSRAGVTRSASQIADGTVVPTGWDVPLEANHELGWFLDHLGGHRVVSHAGSLGHFTTHLIMVPGADGLGIAVTTNASAFNVAGHAGQYDLSLGLARMLLDQDPEPASRSTLLALVVPTALWLVVALLIVAIARYLTRTLPRWEREWETTGRADRWLRRSVLPGAGYLGLAAAVLLTAPLGAARHFYPDAGWALTVLGYLSLGWGVQRTVLTLGVLGWPRRGSRRPARPPAPPPTHPPETTGGAGSTTPGRVPVS